MHQESLSGINVLPGFLNQMILSRHIAMKWSNFECSFGSGFFEGLASVPRYARN